MSRAAKLAAALMMLVGCRNKDSAMLVDTKSSKYQVGDKWKFHARPGEENALLTIVKVEKSSRHGIIVHVSVEGVRVKNARIASGFNEEVPHLPFAEEAISKSVTSRIAQGASLPHFENGYGVWRDVFQKGEAGVFSLTVREALDGIEETMASPDGKEVLAP